MRNFSPKATIRTILIASLFADLLLIGILSTGHLAITGIGLIYCLIAAIGVFMFLVFCNIALRNNKTNTAAQLISAFYYVLAIVILILEGAGSPFTLLLFCLYILINGVLLGGTPIVRSTVLAVLSMFTAQVCVDLNILPDPATPISLGRIAAYSVLYGIFALIGWIAATQIKTAVKNLHTAQIEILQQKNLLTQALESEEYRLKRLQVEELNNLHRLAEVGQQTTLLFHEFANQLMNLSFDMEDNTHQSRKRAQSTVKEIEGTMQAVRQQLSTEHYEAVSLPEIIAEVEKEHRPKLRAAHVRISITKDTLEYAPTVFGDSLKLRQILNILIDNAIQAYAEAPRSSRRTIRVHLSTNAASARLSITDNGVGIPKSQRAHLFAANNTTKLNGHGIGLYISKRTIERQFHGTFQLSDRTDRTEFIVTLRRIT